MLTAPTLGGGSHATDSRVLAAGPAQARRPRAPARRLPLDPLPGQLGSVPARPARHGGFRGDQHRHPGPGRNPPGNDLRPDRRRLRGHPYRRRQGWNTQVAAPLLPVQSRSAVVRAGIVRRSCAAALHGTRDPRHEHLHPIAHNAAQIPTAYLVNVVLIAILISVWEKGAWLAFVTARLQPRLGPLWASVVVAPLFGFIHFPLV